ncbi:hypothetical protein BRCON_0211 [Candidatus Sumerlaea chitinivorans]|uniref:Uncharacterized protein n=1 Tax=Sumerlaea chitinivorans TaxID=2250252 RepID=A0A2Z4Y299_SUMC1|nr:hypothetical protein BRCON_0211 [Candidatus Sumerlaea chitinivorans]
MRGGDVVAAGSGKALPPPFFCTRSEVGMEQQRERGSEATE